MIIRKLEYICKVCGEKNKAVVGYPKEDEEKLSGVKHELKCNNCKTFQSVPIISGEKLNKEGNNENNKKN